MTIQAYDSPQVQNASVDGARLNPGSAPNPLGTLGQSLQQATAGFDQIIQQAQALKGEEALNKLRVSQQEYTGWVKNLNGKQAFTPEAYGGQPGQSLHQAALGWFDGAAGTAGEGLTGHAAQVFKQGAERFRLEFSGHVQDHETRETGVVAKDTYAGALAVEDQNIAQNALSPDGRIQGDSIAQSLQRKVYAAQQLSDFLGEGPDTRQARELEARSSGHAIVLDALLKRNNSQGAQAYFDAFKGQMDKQVVSAMEGKIQQATLANDVQAKANQIEALGLPLDQQDAKAREAFKGNPEGLHTLQGELEHRFNVKRNAQTVAQQETTGKLWDMRFPTLPSQQAVSMPQIMRTPEWAALNGAQRNDLRDQWTAHSKALAGGSNPADEVARYATYQKFLDDPKGLVGLSDPQITSFTGLLGVDLTKKLIDAKRKAGGDLAKLEKGSLNDIPFKDIAGEYGLKVKGNLSPKDLGALGMLRDKALEAIRNEQSVSGKDMLPERKEDIVRGLLRDVKTKKAGDWFSHSGPLFKVESFMDLQATPEEKTAAIDVLTRNEAPTSPANVQAMIEALRAKKGN